jgi:hypothetical protein
LSGWPSDGLLTEPQFIDLVSRQKNLNFTPGDEFLYSNTGYALLAMVVERASGQSLRDYAADHIFKPLGMAHTEFRDDHTQLIPHRAVGYQATSSGFRLNQPELDVVGDGGVFSTVEDLAKWDANFESGRVGGKEGVAELEEPGRLNNGQTIPYALALTVGDMAGTGTFSHRGAYGGYRSAMLMIPSRHLSVITLCNTSGAPTTLVDQVATIHLGLITQQRTAAAARAFDFAAGPFSVGTAPSPGDSTIARKRNDQLTQLAGDYQPEPTSPCRSCRGGHSPASAGARIDLQFITFTTDLFTNNDQMLLHRPGRDHRFCHDQPRHDGVREPADRNTPSWQLAMPLPRSATAWRVCRAAVSGSSGHSWRRYRPRRSFHPSKWLVRQKPARSRVIPTGRCAGKKSYIVTGTRPSRTRGDSVQRTLPVAVPRPSAADPVVVEYAPSGRRRATGEHRARRWRQSSRSVARSTC